MKEETQAKLLLIFLIPLTVLIIMLGVSVPRCDTEVCQQIMKDTAYYPLIFIPIILVVVVGILIKFRNEEKDEVKVVIIDDNPLSIAGYMEEYGDDIFKDEKKMPNKSEEKVEG